MKDDKSYNYLRSDAKRLFRCVRDQQGSPYGAKNLHAGAEVLGDRRAELMSRIWANAYSETAKEFRDKHMEGRTLEGEDEIDEWLATQAGEEVLDYLDKQPELVFPSEWHKPMFDLTFDYYDPRMRIDHAKKGSVLANLRDLAYALHSSTSWTKGQAVWFVLTGEPPQIRMLSSTISHRLGVGKERATIIMHIDPRVAPKDVLAAYRMQRKRILENQRDHDLSDKQVRLLEFVYSRPGQPIERLHNEWNQLYPDWDIEQLGNFRRDFDRAREKLFSTGVLSIFGSQPKKPKSS